MQSPVSASEIWLISPLIVLFVASLIPVTIKVLSRNREQPTFITLIQALVGLTVTASLVVKQWDFQKGYFFNNLLVFDGLASWMNLATLIIAAVTLIISFSNHSTRGHQFTEHVFLVLNATIGMMILVWANDLMVTFIGMEIMSLALYILIGMSHEQKLSKEAAFKYFILGSFGSAIFLYGVALLFGTTGSTSFLRLAEVGPSLLSANLAFTLGVLLVLVGVCFKVSVFPFHAWTPDVYQGAPTSITNFMATGVKMAMFTVFLRLFTTKIFTNSESLVSILQWMAVLSMFLGNLAAVQQQSLKRMLAYSSIAHSGYIFAGLLATGISTGGLVGASSVAFYLFVYSVMSFGAFALISLYEKDVDRVVVLDDLRGLSKARPGLALGLSLCFLSLAGFPPTAGFFGKLYLFSAVVQEGLIWVAVWGIFSSIAGVYYYLRPIVNMYMQDSQGVETEKSRTATAIVFASAAIVLTAGIFSNPILNLVTKSVESLFH